MSVFKWTVDTGQKFKLVTEGPDAGWIMKRVGWFKWVRDYMPSDFIIQSIIKNTA